MTTELATIDKSLEEKVVSEEEVYSGRHAACGSSSRTLTRWKNLGTRNDLASGSFSDRCAR